MGTSTQWTGGMKQALSLHIGRGEAVEIQKLLNRPWQIIPE